MNLIIYENFLPVAKHMYAILLQISHLDDYGSQNYPSDYELCKSR